ncbi:MAG: carboxymuconolactone decarboxylase family protein [Thermoleophilaceae bacterium]|nr:carboxymuconolactone decarboxylase family protein [Thermoleophilaceae bacterium]
MPSPSSAIAKIATWYSQKRFGQNLAPVDVTAASPRILIGYGVFETALESARQMDESLKHLAAMKTAAMVGCEWCIDFGSMLHHKKGLPADQLMALPTFRESDVFNDDEKLVLEYAEALSRTPAEPADELLERLRARFDEAQIVELTATVAIENYRARFNHAFGLAPQGFAKGDACAVPERPAIPT